MPSEKLPLLRALAIPWLVWTMLAIASALFIVREIEQDTVNSATVQGRDITQMVVAARTWNLVHGPVYVLENEYTPPNLYLPEDERTLPLPDGRRLIRINPAYMTRQLATLLREGSDIRIHLTSNKPLNPYNAPHPWEKASLEDFESGAKKEAIFLEKEASPPIARFIMPLPVQASCIQCHESEKYRIGELRGGLSVEWPISAQLGIESQRKREILILHGAVWLIVNALLFIGFRRALNDVSRLKDAHDKLRSGNQRLGEEINRRRSAENFEQLRNAALTAINDGSPLPTALRTIAQGIESLQPGIRCSIRQVDAEKMHLVDAIAPSLPEFFVAPLEGAEIASVNDFSAAAVRSAAPVFVDDIAGEVHDPAVQALAQRAEIAACWAFPVFKSSGEVCGVLTLYHRDTHPVQDEKRQIAEKLAQLCGIAIEHGHDKERLLLAASVFTSAHEGIFITSPSAVILDVNAMFTQLTGYTRQEAIGQTPRLLKSGLQDKEFYAQLWQELEERGYWEGEIWNRKKNGELMPELLRISAVRRDDGQIGHYVALFSDITHAKAHEQQLKRLAHFDALTGLPNRVLFSDRLEQAMRQTDRRQQKIAIVFIDLDGFKAVNDRYGHDTGDQLLIALSQAMRTVLRESDTLARIGGDEFVAVLIDLESTDSCLSLISRLLETVAQPQKIDDIVLQVSASLGITFYPQNEDVDADQLLRQADHAMYQAKQSGKNRYHCFDIEHDRSIRGHHTNLESIRQALVGEEFVLLYQPKVNMRTGCVIGVEALIRWKHPLRGLLPPASFLPVIENHALSAEIGEWVIERALRQMEEWQAMGLLIPVSINVGAYQLQRSDFFDRLKSRLAGHPSIHPADLSIEILETSALEDLIHVSAIIEQCRQIGVSFSLDDFGTGYSSLTYLKRLNVDELKIDKSFVHDMLSDPDDLSILAGILGLSRSLSRQVIAEGVETEAHGALLLQMGCELAQGYGIARPLPAEEIPAWAGSWQPPASWAEQPLRTAMEYPLLVALVEHRAWFAAVAEHISGLRPHLPLTHHIWRLNRWIETEGREQYGEHPGFAEVERLEREIHARADVLSTLHKQGRSDEANAGLLELQALSTSLQDKLSSLGQN